MSADRPSPDDFEALPDKSAATVDGSNPPDRVAITLEKWEMRSLTNRGSVEWEDSKSVEITVKDDPSVAVTDADDYVQVGLRPDHLQTLSEDGAVGFTVTPTQQLSGSIEVVVTRVD